VGRLDGKVAIITGSGGGQGAAAARLFAAEGASVVVSDVKSEDARGVVAGIEEAGGTSTFVECDVSSGEQVEALVQAAVAQYGGIDVLYNNAGIWLLAGGDPRWGETDGPSPKLAENVWDRTVDINLKGTYLCCRFAIPHMIERGGGSIINVASVGVFKGGGGASDAYTASKGGIFSITKTLACEHGPYGIRVNALAPGPIHTPMTPFLGAEGIEKWARRNIPMGRIGQPEDVAKAALFLASDDSQWVSGSTLFVDGGYSAV
jgi:NAD(P)-dependent dehydrogenase (short-subunit alcohol dehydrogenase family)